PIYTYRLFGAEKQVTPLKLVMGVLIFCFAWLDLLPRFRKMEIDTKWLPLGGVISGFFGGLSGHQGAARTAFLVKTGMSTPQFVGTTAVVGFGVDMIRLSVYAWGFFVSNQVDTTNLAGAMKLAAVATVFGFVGLLISRLFLKKVTMKAVQTLAGILLLVVSVVLVTGVV
ncbi:MAG: TSUP family transporter, partial [Planctomycetota bacterium]